MSSIKELAIRLAKDGPRKIISSPRLVQAILNRAYIVRTTQAQLVWETPYYPQYYITKSAFTKHVQVKQGEAIESEDGSTVAHRLTLSVGDKSLNEVIAFTDSLTGPAEPLRGLIKINFAAVDQWYEESTPIFVHPKDPYKRVDILPSTRQIRVFIDDILVADAPSSHHLYETSLPVRYYLPATSVRPDILRPSSTRTQCPYKGEAEYYSVELNGKLHKDIIWFYRTPTLESIKVEGLLCFYNDKVTIELDGEKQDIPIRFG